MTIGTKPCISMTSTTILQATGAHTYVSMHGSLVPVSKPCSTNWETAVSLYHYIFLLYILQTNVCESVLYLNWAWRFLLLLLFALCRMNMENPLVWFWLRRTQNKVKVKWDFKVNKSWYTISCIQFLLDIK